MNLSTSKTGSSSCQCTTSLNKKLKETKNNVSTIHRQLRIMLADFLAVHWSLLGPGSEEMWCGTYTDKPDGSWDRMAKETMANFSGPVNQYFVPPVPFERERKTWCKSRFGQLLSDDQKLSKLCCDAGLKIVELGQYFFTLDTEERNEMQHLRIEILIESLFRNGAASWVRIVIQNRCKTKRKSIELRRNLLPEQDHD